MRCGGSETTFRIAWEIARLASSTQPSSDVLHPPNPLDETCKHKLHSQKWTTCSGLMKTRLNNVLLPAFFYVINNNEQYCWAWISPRSGVTTLNNDVDSFKIYGHQNIVQSCFHKKEHIVHFSLSITQVGPVVDSFVLNHFTSLAWYQTVLYFCHLTARN